MSLQVEHKTEKGTLLFVKVPDKSKHFVVSRSKGGKYSLLYSPENIKETRNMLLPSRGFKLIGLTSEVTEDQSRNIMDDLCYNYEFAFGVQYFLYALDSFKSLMDHLKVYEVNPITPEMHDTQGRNYNQWKEYEQRTGLWVLLFKPN